MNRYLVTWQIDIEADTPREAARLALDVQRDHTSIALVFDVRQDGEDEATRVDLAEADED